MRLNPRGALAAAAFATMIAAIALATAAPAAAQSLKPSQLPAASAVAATDIFPGSQGCSGSPPTATCGATNGVTGAQLKTWAQSGLATVATSGLATDLSGTLGAANGGTGVASPTAHTMPINEGSSAQAHVAALTNGQLVIGQTGADPAAETVSGDATLAAGGVLTVTKTSGAPFIAAATTHAAAGNASGFTSTAISGTTLQMLGAGASCAVTPTTSGNVQVTFNLSLALSAATVASDGIKYKLAYGTGTAPTNTAAATGTVVGGQFKIAAGANQTAISTQNAVWTGVITGLSVGTAYWLDLQEADNSANHVSTFTVSNCSWAEAG